MFKVSGGIVIVKDAKRLRGKALRYTIQGLVEEVGAYV